MASFRTYAIAALLLTLSNTALAEETFVTIHKVSGNQMLVVKDDASGGNGGRGRGMQGAASGVTGGAAGGMATGRGRGRFGGASVSNMLTVTIPSSAKITSALRERRTFEFRALGELPGGIRSSVFTRMEKPLQARIVTNDNRITEVNVISGDTDINQSATASSGQAVLAVKPKRPPMKRISNDG